jgi:hypothetical protein
MYKILVSAAAALFLSVGFTSGSYAGTDDSVLAPAKIIFFRAGEASKTRRINFNALVNGEKLEKLRYGKPVVAMLESGEYELGASIKGSTPLLVTIQPGQTYYVHAGLKRLGQTNTPSLVMVDEHVALTQQPAIEGLI